jgi:hypothetical protein
VCGSNLPNLRDRADQNRHDQPLGGGFHRRRQGGLFARVRDGGRHRIERAASGQQLFVLSGSGLMGHEVLARTGIGVRAAGPVSFRKNVRTIASATP